MEMKINFNKLFNAQQSEYDTPSTTSLENSYQQEEYQEPSLDSAPAYQIDYQYKFNQNLFDETVEFNHSDILHGLSSVDKSLDNSLEKNNNNSKNPRYKDNSIIINPMMEKGKTPGERLYYQSKQNTLRKKKQLQRFQAEIQEKQIRETTFKPVINPNSKKILEKCKSPVKKQQKRKQKQQIKPLEDRKQEQELKNCTFKPAINSNSLKSSEKLGKSRLSNTITYERDKAKVFDQLYNQHKLKQMRKQMKIQELKPKQKKMTKAQLEKFFQKNQQYIDKKQQKQKLIKNVSSQYDMSSGRKLFSPQTEASPIFKSTSTRQLKGQSATNSLSQSPVSNLFNKMTDSQIQVSQFNQMSLESIKKLHQNMKSPSSDKQHSSSEHNNSYDNKQQVAQQQSPYYYQQDEEYQRKMKTPQNSLNDQQQQKNQQLLYQEKLAIANTNNQESQQESSEGKLEPQQVIQELQDEENNLDEEGCEQSEENNQQLSDQQVSQDHHNHHSFERASKQSEISSSAQDDSHLQTGQFQKVNNHQQQNNSRNSELDQKSDNIEDQENNASNQQAQQVKIEEQNIEVDAAEKVQQTQEIAQTEQTMPQTELNNKIQVQSQANVQDQKPTLEISKKDPLENQQQEQLWVNLKSPVFSNVQETKTKIQDKTHTEEQIPVEEKPQSISIAALLKNKRKQAEKEKPVEQEVPAQQQQKPQPINIASLLKSKRKKGSITNSRLTSNSRISPQSKY